MRTAAKGQWGYKTLKKFAAALDVSIDQLVGEESSPSSDGNIQSLYNQLNASNKVSRICQEFGRALAANLHRADLNESELFRVGEAIGTFTDFLNGIDKSKDRK